MTVHALSRSFTVRRLDEEDVSLVLRLCRGNPQYYRYCPPPATEESIIHDMYALPPEKGMGDKYYLGFFDGSSLIAVLDYIHCYPDNKTGFIGFFMLSASLQGKGIAGRIIEDVCEQLAKEGVRAARLAWVKGNQQAERFWHKHHFRETGQSSETDGHTIMCAERALSS